MMNHKSKFFKNQSISSPFANSNANINTFQNQNQSQNQNQNQNQNNTITYNNNQIFRNRNNDKSVMFDSDGSIWVNGNLAINELGISTSDNSGKQTFNKLVVSDLMSNEITINRKLLCKEQASIAELIVEEDFVCKGVLTADNLNISKFEAANIICKSKAIFKEISIKDKLEADLFGDVTSNNTSSFNKVEIKSLDANNADIKTLSIKSDLQLGNEVTISGNLSIRNDDKNKIINSSYMESSHISSIEILIIKTTIIADSIINSLIIKVPKTCLSKGTMYMLTINEYVLYYTCDANTSEYIQFVFDDKNTYNKGDTITINISRVNNTTIEYYGDESGIPLFVLYTAKSKTLSFDKHLYINTNVGIGIREPSKQLEVNGDASINGDLTIKNHIQSDVIKAEKANIANKITSETAHFKNIIVEDDMRFSTISNKEVIVSSLTSYNNIEYASEFSIECKITMCCKTARLRLFHQGMFHDGTSIPSFKVSINNDVLIPVMITTGTNYVDLTLPKTKMILNDVCKLNIYVNQEISLLSFDHDVNYHLCVYRPDEEYVINSKGFTQYKLLEKEIISKTLDEWRFTNRVILFDGLMPYEGRITYVSAAVDEGDYVLSVNNHQVFSTSNNKSVQFALLDYTKFFEKGDDVVIMLEKVQKEPFSASHNYQVDMMVYVDQSGFVENIDNHNNDHLITLSEGINFHYKLDKSGDLDIVVDENNKSGNIVVENTNTVEEIIVKLKCGDIIIDKYQIELGKSKFISYCVTPDGRLHIR